MTALRHGFGPLFAAVILAIGSANVSAQLTDGLVAYYSFDDGTAADLSGFGNDATGGDGTGFDAGHVGSGGAFSSGTDFFEVPWNEQNGLNGSHSTQIWMRTETTGQRGYLLGQSSGSPNHFPYHLEIASFSGDVANSLNDGFTDRLAETPLTDGNWHHMVTTWNESTATNQIWVNGVLEQEAVSMAGPGGATGTIANDAQLAQDNMTPLRFGGTDEFGGRLYTGQLDEVALWNRVLSDAEIQQLYNDGAGFTLVAPVGLSLLVDPTTGLVQIRNTSEEDLALSSYEIRSAAGSLNPAGWNPISGQNIAGFPSGSGDGDGWEPGPNVGSGELVEWFLEGDSTLAAGGAVSLGQAFAIGGAEDLEFRFTDEDVIVRSGFVEFGEVVPPDAVPGDFNNDGVVNAADYTVWRDGLGGTDPLPNDDGLGTPVGPAHYDLWKSNFGAVASGAALGTATVPEPASLWLGGLAIAALLVAVRRRSSRNVS